MKFINIRTGLLLVILIFGLKALSDLSKGQYLLLTFDLIPVLGGYIILKKMFRDYLSKEYSLE